MRQQQRRGLDSWTGRLGRSLLRPLVATLLLGASRVLAEPIPELPLLPLGLELFELTPPTLLAEQPAPPPTLLGAMRFGPARSPALLTLDLSIHYLHLAVHGDKRPGLSPFLGTSTSAFAGLRLRF